MKIGLHCNQFDSRGSSKVIYDTSMALQSILGHIPICITSAQNENEGLPLINSKFKSITYDKPPIHKQSYHEILDTKNILSNIVEKERLDLLYMIKSGNNDGCTPVGCRIGIHCVFTMNQPHGNIYAGVSNWIAKKHNKSLFVPHIIKNLNPTENLRLKYNIPKSALVVGRHGGMDTFNVDFVKEAIKTVLNHRKNIYFLFLSTTKFIEHERVIFIDWVSTEQEKFNFIHSCDVMLHARHSGETFGIAVAEFSIANKPVITWSGFGDHWPHDKSHLEILDNNAILYNNTQELADILYSIDHTFINNNNWDMYSEDYNEITVINKFKEVFIAS